MTQPGKAVQRADELCLSTRRGQIEWRLQRCVKTVAAWFRGQAVPQLGFGIENSWTPDAASSVAVVAKNGAAESKEFGLCRWNEVNRIARQFGGSVSGWW